MEREQEINDLKEQLKNQSAELDKARAHSASLETTVSRLTEENKNLQLLLSSLSANPRHKTAYPMPLPNPSDSAGISADGGGGDTPCDEAVMRPMPLPRRRKSVPLNKATIDKLKNDRKSYAAVCDAALRYWQLLCDANLVDADLRLMPACSPTVAARIACRFQTEVDPSITWSFFQRHWNIKRLQSYLKRDTYKDQEKYKIVNTIFGLAADAPFLTKSAIAD